MSKQFTVYALGDGTQENPFRPDLPNDATFVGKHDPETNTYTILVPDATVVERFVVEDGDTVDAPEEKPVSDEKPTKTDAKTVEKSAPRASRVYASDLKGFSLS